MRMAFNTSSAVKTDVLFCFFGDSIKFLLRFFFFKRFFSFDNQHFGNTQPFVFDTALLNSGSHKSTMCFNKNTVFTRKIVE